MTDKPKDEPTCRGSHDPHLSGRCWVCGGWRWEAPVIARITMTNRTTEAPKGAKRNG